MTSSIPVCSLDAPTLSRATALSVSSAGHYCITAPPAADDELTSLSTVSTATGVTRSYGFSCTGSANRVVGLCVVGKQYCGSCSQHFPVASLTAQCRPVLQHQSLRPIKLQVTRVVGRLPWSSYLCLRLRCPQTVDALAAPHPAFLAGFLCRTRVTRFETAVMTRSNPLELIFLIQVPC